MILSQALEIAGRVKSELAPHCERIEIAGSIRRQKPDVGDIEIVCIPKPYETGLFASGIAKVAGQWQKVKGEFPCLYTQRILPHPDGDHFIKLDLFIATKDNWGLIFAIRTGSAEYSHRVLAAGWVRRGYWSVGGELHNHKGDICEIPEERDLFRLIGIPFCKPEDRNL